MNYTFISGATGGIGKAFVFECAKQKQNLFLTGRSIDKLTQLKQQVQKDFDVDVQICACMLDAQNVQNANEHYSYHTVLYDLGCISHNSAEERRDKVKGNAKKNAYTAYKSERGENSPFYSVHLTRTEILADYCKRGENESVKHLEYHRIKFSYDRVRRHHLIAKRVYRRHNHYVGK